MSLTNRLDKKIEEVSHQLTKLDDENKSFSPEWHRLEGYYYGLLDVKEHYLTHSTCDLCKEKGDQL